MLDVDSAILGSHTDVQEVTGVELDPGLVSVDGQHTA